MLAENTEKYDVKEIENILTHEECDILIEFAKCRKDWETSQFYSNIIDSKKGSYQKTDKDIRNSKTLLLNDKDHPIIQKIALITELLTGLPLNTQEDLQITHYNTDGKFHPHYDANNMYGGQRRATLIIYLNDDFEGGETVFTKLDKIITPKKGHGLLFLNTDSSDEIIADSMHQGNKVIAGEKWICTKWSHSKQYEPF